MYSSAAEARTKLATKKHVSYDEVNCCQANSKNQSSIFSYIDLLAADFYKAPVNFVIDEDSSCEYIFTKTYF